MMQNVLPNRFATARSVRVSAAAKVPQQAISTNTTVAPNPTSDGVAGISGNLLTGLVILEAVALIGAFTTGTLARKRRIELEAVNRKLRDINKELRSQMEQDLVPEADDKEAMVAYRNAVENAGAATPFKMHPVTTMSEQDQRVADYRREVSKFMKAAKEAVKKGNGEAALKSLQRAEKLVIEIQDPIAERTVVRAQAKALRSMGDLKGAVASLERGLSLSAQMGDTGADADTFGQLGDLYVDLGYLDKAAEMYDRCIGAIKEGRGTVTESWDC